MLSGDATGLLGVNAIGDCLDTYINIPDAFTYDGTAANNLHKYSELCGEAWAADGVATTLGPLRCESAHWYHATGISISLSLSAYTTPFSLEVFADDASPKVLVSAATTSASGFEMVYQQIPCGL